MGAYWAHALPRYMDKWKVPYILRPGWDTRSRKSGGFNSVKAIGVHYDASSKNGSADSAYGWSCINCPDRPVGNGSLGRDGVFQLWAAGAANTMGVGGPVLTQRGVIGLNDGNANMFAIEAGNNGVGEPWTPQQIANYPLLCCAVIDWATHETPGAPLSPGDIFAHWEWCAPSCFGRKVDPAGPSPWLPSPANAPKYPNIWDMNKFRGSVAALMFKPQPPTPIPGDSDMSRVMFRLDDADAAFFAMADSNGIALQVEWTGSGEDPNVVERINAQIAAGITVKNIVVANLMGVSLVGPLPRGDGRHNWTGREFGNVLG